MKQSTIDFDPKLNDFLINGKPFLVHLRKHENVIPGHHLVSIISQPGACDRLLGVLEPDLQCDHVAIYLCGHCGGYDGNPIGVKVIVEGENIIWKEIGYYNDYEDKDSYPFSKVKEYVFSRSQYTELKKKLKIYEP
jgi:hypothetical protein